MSDTSTAASEHDSGSSTPSAAPPAPMVDAAHRQELAPGVFVIPDQDVFVVPNIGIVVGEHSALVIDTGLGPANGERVLRAAREVAAGRKLYVTSTHYHSEHGMGLGAFVGEATIVYNRSQRDELLSEGDGHIALMRSLGGPFADLLSGVELVLPELVYENELDLDLGGRTVQLRHLGPGHTAGDQVVFLPAERIMFAGDLLEAKQHPMLEPGSTGNGSARWLNLLSAMERLDPAVIVPGHGEISDISLISEYRTYFSDMRDGVSAAQQSGVPLDEYKPGLMASTIADHPDWANGQLLDFTIAAVDAELAGGPGARWANGLEVIGRELGLPADQVFGVLREQVGEPVARQVIRSTGDAWSDGVLTARDRSLITIGILAVSGGTPDGLRPHIRLALTNGTTRQELEGLAGLLALYGGIPVGAWTARTVSQEIDEPTAVI